MLVNIRYHLITIIALFITLTIGILIGSTIIGSDSIIHQQQRLIGDLKNDFKNLRSENNKFKTQIKSLEKRLALNLKYRKNIISILFKNRLRGEKLLVVKGNEVKEKKVARIIDYLKLANPRVIDSLKKDELTKEDYTKIIFLGEINNKLRSNYSNSLVDSVELSAQDIDSFYKTIEKIVNFVLSSKPSLKKKGR
mgnify:CR=1 FL=1